MSAGLTITTFGFKELEEKLNGMGDEIQKEAGKLIFDGAQRISAMAQSLAPVDYGGGGGLKGQIRAEKEGEFGATVISGADYSAYQEFGTGTKVDVPAELTEYAWQFKGIKEVVGINPHPFFFPSLDAIAPSIVTDVETMLQEVADK